MAATPTIVIGRNNWGIKLSNLLGYYQSDDNFFVKREFSATRASLATRVNSSGFIEAPRTNLALQSQTFDVSGTWAPVIGGTGSSPSVTANAVISPDGTQNAETVLLNRGAGNTITDQSTLAQNITLATSGTYTFSVYAKATSSADIGKQIFLRAGGAGSLIAYTLTANWVRLTRTEAAIASGSNTFQIGNRGTITADNSVSVDLWGAQLETGSVATSYIPTTTSAVTIFGGLTVNAANANNIPRIDYTGGSPALLVEPSGTNGILNSEDTATSWGLGGNLSSGYVDVIGVSGNNLTVAVSGSNIGAAAGRLQRSSNNVALASGSTYTISFLMKKTGTHTIGGYYALITGAAAGDLGGGFNVGGSFSSGSIYNSAGTTNRIRRVEQWGTDVYRCSETFTMTANGTLTVFTLGPLSGVTSQSNPAVGLGIAFAAPQIELGAVPTSFIPTTTAAVSRSADVVSLSGATDYIGQTEGTIYVELNIRALSGARRIFGISDGTSSNRIALTMLDSELRVVKDGATALLPTATSAGTLKVALVYSSVGLAISVNGSAVVTDATSGVGTYNRIDLGQTEAGAAQFNDRFRTAALYNKRLPNDQLQALTTL